MRFIRGSKAESKYLVGIADARLDATTAGEVSFGEMYGKLLPRMLRRAKRFELAADDVDDVVQDACCYVFGRWNELSLDQRGEALFFTALNGAMRDFLRKNKRFVSFGDDLEEALGRTGALDSRDTEMANERMEYADLVHRSMKRLPSAPKLVWELYFDEHMTVPEIAEVLDLDQSVVRKHVNKGRDAIGKSLDGTGIRLSRESARQLADIAAPKAMEKIARPRASKAQKKLAPPRDPEVPND